MGILGKTLGLAGVAVAGSVALTKNLLGGNKKKLAELDTEFARTTADYQAKKSRLEAKVNKGNSAAIKKLEALEREYFVKKAEYENKRKTLLPKKNAIEKERESKEFEQRLEIDKAKAMHDLYIDKTITMHSLEMEKEQNYHQWDLEDAKTSHGLELESDQKHHEWDLEKTKALHNMEMEKIELTSKVGTSANNSNAPQNEVNQIVCSNCGNKNALGSKFCNNCGTPIAAKKFCTNCGTSLDANSKFCSMCGQSI